MLSGMIGTQPLMELKKQKDKYLQVKNKPRTVDRNIIYPSMVALVKALVSGNNGSRSPTFRYVKSGV